MGIFDKIREGLKKTRDNISGQITQMVNSFTKIDEELFEELEEKDPNHFAVRQYKKYKLAAGDICSK